VRGHAGHPENERADALARRGVEQARARSMRKVILDTETTGLDFRTGDRVVEIGCVELVGRG
jgi:DNA polymerase III epsilon subunit-like protein